MWVNIIAVCGGTFLPCEVFRIQLVYKIQKFICFIILLLFIHTIIRITVCYIEKGKSHFVDNHLLQLVSRNNNYNFMNCC